MFYNDILYEILSEIYLEGLTLSDVVEAMDEFSKDIPAVATAISICLKDKEDGCSQPLGNRYKTVSKR